MQNHEARLKLEEARAAVTSTVSALAHGRPATAGFKLEVALTLLTEVMMRSKLFTEHERETIGSGLTYSLLNCDTCIKQLADCQHARAQHCDDCGDTVDEIIGCPDGHEVCHRCFNSGAH